jgi:hypothetical protein
MPKGKKTEKESSISKNVIITPNPDRVDASASSIFPVLALEKKMATLSVDDVEIIRLTFFEHDGKSYFRDSTKNKVFTRKGPTSVGSYVGRWNSRTRTIDTSPPDSDAESES